MFCPNCGNQIADGAAFCSVCGAKLGAAPARTPDAAPAQTLKMSSTFKPAASSAPDAPATPKAPVTYAPPAAPPATPEPYAPPAAYAAPEPYAPPAAPAAPEAPVKRKMSTGAVIGIIAGVLALLAAVAVVLYVLNVGNIKDRLSGKDDEKETTQQDDRKSDGDTAKKKEPAELLVGTWSYEEDKYAIEMTFQSGGKGEAKVFYDGKEVQNEAFKWSVDEDKTLTLDHDGDKETLTFDKNKAKEEPDGDDVFWYVDGDTLYMGGSKMTSGSYSYSGGDKPDTDKPDTDKKEDSDLVGTWSCKEDSYEGTIELRMTFQSGGKGELKYIYGGEEIESADFKWSVDSDKELSLDMDDDEVTFRYSADAGSDDDCWYLDGSTLYLGELVFHKN